MAVTSSARITAKYTLSPNYAPGTGIRLKGWKALPSGYINQDLVDVWLAG
jgi:hypothetical protein